MKLMQQIKNLLGRKNAQKVPQTDPLKPDFDIQAWLTEVQQIRAQHPDRLNPCAPTGAGLLLDISDCPAPEEKAEQDRRLAEWERQQEEAKHMKTPADHPEDHRRRGFKITIYMAM